MLREKEEVVTKAEVILDVVVIAFSFMAAFLLRSHFHLFYTLDLIPGARVVVETALSMSDYLVVLFLVVPIWIVALHVNGIYEPMRTKTLREIVWTTVKAALLVMVLFGTLTFLLKLKFVSRAFFAIFLCASSASIMAEKALIFFAVHYVLKQGYHYRRLLVVGTGRRAAYFINKIEKHPEWGLRIVGAVDYEENQFDKKVEDVKVIGMLGDIPRILHDNAIDEVVFVIPRLALGLIEKSLYICETEGVKATLAVDLFDFKIAKARQTELEDIPLLTFETTVAREWQLFIKRTIDVIVSGLGIVILSPFFLVVTILIKLTSPGPVLYKHKRMGLNGRRFIFYKFRSMYEGSHEKLSELMENNEMQGPVFKMKADPRVTPIGRFLRKFSIDELPQLFNVFVGHMSLVGPRPPIPKEVAQYDPWQRRRLSMRPGLTCLWQISGRNKIGFDEWMKLDLEYLDNWSLWLDFKILLKTIPVVLFGIGAY